MTCLVVLLTSAAVLIAHAYFVIIPSAKIALVQRAKAVGNLRYEVEWVRRECERLHTSLAQAHRLIDDMSIELCELQKDAGRRPASDTDYVV